MKVLGVKDSFGMVMERGKNAGVMMLPGNQFFPDRKAKSPYVRASFSVVPLEDMDKVSSEHLCSCFLDRKSVV